jgi:hypothetical protein
MLNDIKGRVLASKPVSTTLCIEIKSGRIPQYKYMLHKMLSLMCYIIGCTWELLVETWRKGIPPSVATTTFYPEHQNKR